MVNVLFYLFTIMSLEGLV